MRSANVSLRAEALARLASVNPAAYARTRNHLDGAVSGLSPFITHGVITLPEVLANVAARHRIAPTHKFVFELSWREYFRHVWQHRGEGIFESIHEGPLPEAAYTQEVPADVREACSGVPAIDQAVQQLYRTGMLHNHARMWLASYLVHLRKVHWRAGADWLWAHLLDGDLASNHLSWQWVAGTGSHKPYLFNADNVARYAPADWHSTDTVIDSSYEALDRLARSPRAVPAAPAGLLAGVAEPPLLIAPTAPWPEVDAAALAGRAVWLVHPWALRAPPASWPTDSVVLAWWPAAWHRSQPWSGARWAWVQRGMAALAQQAISDLSLLSSATAVGCWADPHLEHLGTELPASVQRLPSPMLFAVVERPCASFSQWWTRAMRDVKALHELPGFAALTAGPLFDAAT
jgi:deoxyribodipyrimidine photo-lyase